MEKDVIYMAACIQALAFGLTRRQEKWRVHLHRQWEPSRPTGPRIQLGLGVEPQGTSAINPPSPTALTGSYQGLLKMQI